MLPNTRDEIPKEIKLFDDIQFRFPKFSACYYTIILIRHGILVYILFVIQNQAFLEFIDNQKLIIL